MTNEVVEDMNNLRHMLGIAENIPKRDWGYRNYFNAGGNDVESMKRLVDQGLAQMYRPDYWMATEAGMKAVGMTAAQIKKAISR